MIRVANVTEKNIFAIPAKVITLVAATATDVLSDISTDAAFRGVEVMGRYIQNLTGADLYYCIGQTCDALTNYHGILSDKQQVDFSNVGQRISVYSVAGGKVAPTVLRRKDLTETSGIIPQPNAL